MDSRRYRATLCDLQQTLSNRDIASLAGLQLAFVAIKTTYQFSINLGKKLAERIESS